MKRILLLMAAVWAVSSVSAQKINGQVTQKDDAPGEYATVILHAAKDSSMVKGAIADERGMYEFYDIAPGFYFVSASLVGAGKASSPVFNYDGGTRTIDKIGLVSDAKELAEVTVVARKPLVEIQADKTILNVEGTINSTGQNALELLRKAPGVTVDNNDNVNVKGKNKVRVMIDGREVPLDSKNLAALLKNTQSSDIASIEIISNPSAKYDASGNAGIVNIRLKKNKSLGANGSVGANMIYGETLKGGLNLSLNNRSKKLNTFGTINSSYGDWHNTQNFVREQSGMVFDQQAKQTNQNRNNTARVGADWYINSKHTVGVLLNGGYDPGNWKSKSIANISTLETRNRIDSILDAANSIDGNDRNLSANFNYRFTDTSGRSVNVDVDRGAYRLRKESFQPNYYRLNEGGALLGQKIYRNNTPTDIDITTVKADYEQPLFKGAFSAGVKIADVRTDNTFDFFNVLGENVVKDLDVSNRFKYKERTSAAYVNYNRKFGKKLNVQTGLRMENTDYTGELISATPQNGETVSDNYTEWFPSAAVTYTFTPKIGLNLTYSRRIDRPSYQDLNPFEFKLDELTYQKGNPMLRPQFTNSVELSPTFNGYPLLTVGYSHTKDVFTQVLDTAKVRATFITQANIADQRNYTLSVNIPTPIAKWWEGLISFTGYQSHFEAKFRDGYEVDHSFKAFNIYGEQTIRVKHGWSFQLSGWYNSRAFWGTLRSNAQGAMDFGIQKKILDGKGDLRLRVGDILGTAGWSGENLFTPGLHMTANGTWESQTVSLNFNYRFGSAEIKSARRRSTGLEDEKRRIKQGNN